MAQTKAKAKAKTDKAKRPSPPDRDGDGKSGGSKPGNQTDPAALGTADAVLAEQAVAGGGTATVIIKGYVAGVKRGHPIGVNGRIRHLPVNLEVRVDAAELHALENSHVDFTTVVPLSETAADEGGAVGSSEPPSTEQPSQEGGETNPEQSGEGDGSTGADETAAQTGGEQPQA